MTEEVWSEVTTPTLRRYLAAIQAALDERAGRSPTESAVGGALLISFDAEWPEGWCWQDEPLWGDGRQRNDPAPLEPDRLYDLTDWSLDHDDGTEDALWAVFKEWYDRREGAS